MGNLRSDPDLSGEGSHKMKKEIFLTAFVEMTQVLF